MPKLFLRLVALLLVPALLSASVPTTSAKDTSRDTRNGLYMSQALGIPIFTMRRSFEGRTTGWMFRTAALLLPVIGLGVVLLWKNRPFSSRLWNYFHSSPFGIMATDLFLGPLAVAVVLMAVTVLIFQVILEAASRRWSREHAWAHALDHLLRFLAARSKVIAMVIADFRMTRALPPLDMPPPPSSPHRRTMTMQSETKVSARGRDPFESFLAEFLRLWHYVPPSDRSLFIRETARVFPYAEQVMDEELTFAESAYDGFEDAQAFMMRLGSRAFDWTRGNPLVDFQREASRVLLEPHFLLRDLPALDLASGPGGAQMMEAVRNQPYIFADRSWFVESYLNRAKEVASIGPNVIVRRVDIRDHVSLLREPAYRHIQLSNLSEYLPDMSPAWAKALADHVAPGGTLAIEYETLLPLTPAEMITRDPFMLWMLAQSVFAGWESAVASYPRQHLGTQRFVNTYVLKKKITKRAA